MLILLPSGAKATGRRGSPLDFAALSFTGLTPQRERVARVLAAASA